MKFLLLMALIFESHYVLAQKGDAASQRPAAEETVPTQEEVKNKIVVNREERLMNCVGSLASQRGDLGVIPLGGDKYEVEMKAPFAEESERRHLIVDAAEKSVKVCKVVEGEKVCRETNDTTSSHEDSLQEVMKENLATAAIKPFKDIEKSYEERTIDLKNTIKELQRKRKLIQTCSDLRECIVGDVKRSRTWGSELATQQTLWTALINKSLVSKKDRFENWDELKNNRSSLPSKSKVIKTVTAMIDMSRERLANLPTRKKQSKEILERKLALLESTSSESGAKLCENVGLKKVVTSVQEEVSAEERQNEYQFSGNVKLADTSSN